MASEHPIARMRNIGVAAHIDAGKTTLTERVLYYAGLIHRMGTVDDGNTTTDFLPEERERGITITSAAVTVNWKNHRINIIDTPGHVDFTAEVERSLRVLDGAVVVFCGYSGVQAQSETVWRQADRYRTARIVFINKLDRVGADFDRVVDEVRKRLGARPLPVVFPWASGPTGAVPCLGESGQALQGVVDLVTMRALRFDLSGRKADFDSLPLEGELEREARIRRDFLLEQVADEDDEVAALYLEGAEVPPEALKAAIRRLTLESRVVPVLGGSALRNVGVQPVLDAACDYLPSPRDIRRTEGTHPETGAPEIRKNYPEQPFSGLIFKTISDVHGETAYIRVYSGILREGKRVLNTRRARKERMGRPYRLFADEREALKEVIAGDIIGVVGLKFSSTGDTLCDAEHPIIYERAQFPEPVVSMAVEPRTNAERPRFLAALERISRDDPTFFSWFDEETGQQVIAGMGELHLEIRCHQIEREYGVPIRVGEVRVSYREGVRSSGEADFELDQAMAGKPRYACVRLKVERFTNEEPGRLVFVSKAAPESIPPELVPVIEQAARDAASGGVLRGDPLIHVKVTLLGGAHRSELSGEAAFSLAATEAFRKAAQEAGPVLLEPVMSFEVLCPEGFLGAVLRDLRARGAEVKELTKRGDMSAIQGLVPLAKMFQYASSVRSLTQGRGTYTMEPSEYRGVSPQDYERLVGEKWPG